MDRLGKLLIMILLIGVVAVGSFAAGMFFYANFYSVAQADSSVTTLSVSSARESVQSLQAQVENMPVNFDTFLEAWSFLDEEFYGEIPPDNERIYGAIRGMVTSFSDQHTAFIDPTRAAIGRENIGGSFEGIGATIRLDENGRLIIADPFPDRPAFKAGLRPDDIVLEIDGQSIEGLSLYEAVLLIRGPADSTVVLTVLREGKPEPFEVPIVRAKIEIEVVESELLENNIGYVRLTQFSGGAADKIVEAVEVLVDEGITSIVFDLRSNPGGLLSEAVNVSSLFIEEGSIVIERSNKGADKIFEAKGEQSIPVDLPLVVLVNGGSASASEIVAGAIQDTGRGMIIGEQTFGKGSVQLPHTLSDGSELRVTIAEWLTPNKRQVHGEGITPDIIVELTVEDIENERDPQLDEAVSYLRRPAN